MPFLIHLVLCTSANLVDASISGYGSITCRKKLTALGHLAAHVDNCEYALKFGREEILGRYPYCCAREVSEAWEIARARHESVRKPSARLTDREKGNLELMPKWPEGG